MKVCLFANTFDYPNGGGHFWVYLNWALGFRSVGCDVIWMEGVSIKPESPTHLIQDKIDELKRKLERYGLSESLSLWSWQDKLPAEIANQCLNLSNASEADLLISLQYFLPQILVNRFRRSTLIDIDPGLLQLWVSGGHIKLAKYDVYFTTGETVGKPGAKFPSGNLKWQYTRPCVALDYWSAIVASRDASFTTVSHWTSGEYMEDDQGIYSNEKRDGFLPYLDLPKLTKQPLELALFLSDKEIDDLHLLQDGGWSIRDSRLVASTPWDYQFYIQGSRGEFSCAKPSCVRLQNAWVSDRTICYLASGKPVVVQHTGKSNFLPDSDGMFRFRDLKEAVWSLETVASDYERQCRLARALAEEYFDAGKIAGSVLERALA
jgi:hypothetical protein